MLYLKNSNINNNKCNNTSGKDTSLKSKETLRQTIKNFKNEN